MKTKPQTLAVLHRGSWQRIIGFPGFDTVIVGPLVQGLWRCGVGVRIKI